MVKAYQVKGSEAARRRMAYLRSLKKKKSGGRKKKGGSFILPLIRTGLGLSINYYKKKLEDRQKQIDEINRLKQLKKQQGGGFDSRDIIDGLMGPYGWIAMAMRKKREREIEQLKRELS